MTGSELKEFREAKGMTQAQFAELIGLKREKTISDYERGDLAVPDWLITLVNMMKASKREMSMTNEGLTDTDVLLSYLESLLTVEQEEGSVTRVADYNISDIKNYKGNWEVIFDDVPEVSVLLCLFAFFETVQNWDGLSKLVFNAERLFQKTFEDVAGCAKGDFGKTMAEAIAYAAETAMRKREIERRQTIN